MNNSGDCGPRHQRQDSSHNIINNRDVHGKKEHHPHYRYNHFPQRSSSSYSSSNLSSYSSTHPSLSSLHNGGKASPSSTASTSTMSYPSSVPSPPLDKDTGSTTNDDISIQSALSLYQAFAAFSGSGNAASDVCHDKSNGTGGCDHADEQWTANTRLDETISSEYIGDINESQSESNHESITESDGRRVSSQDAASDESLSLKGGERNSDPDENDEESTSSWASYLSIPTNIHLPSNFITRHRKKIGTILLSTATLWVYSQYTRSRRQQRRYYLRHGRHNNHIQRQSHVWGVCRWILQLMSPVRIAKYLQQLALTSGIKQLTPSRQSSQPWNNAAAAPLSHLLAMAKAGNVSKVLLRGSVLSYLHSMQSPSTSNQSSQRQRWSQTTLPSPKMLNDIVSSLLSNGCDDITTMPESIWRSFLKGPAVMALPFAYLAALYWMMRRLQCQQFDDNDGGDSWKREGGSGHSTRHVTTFDDVAGIDSSLQELSEIIRYMRDPSSFHSVGAQPPRGVLLHGPPGSGKTLLARAIAGEAKRSVDGTHHVGANTIDSFAVCSGSEFVETYVGRGAARVRSLFKNVREEALRNFKLRQKRRQIKRWNTVTEEGNALIKERGIVRRTMSQVGGSMVDAWERMQSLVAPAGNELATEEDGCSKPMAIIFIDEIDALAKRRDSGIGLPQSLGGGGCDERDQTLNQLLTEMDGFASGSLSSGVDVIVIAATNRPEVLDPAIMRPGRFDRHVRVTLPDARGREAILRVHARRIRWDRSTVKFGELPTDNFSGADLKNVINEAALLAVRCGSPVVKQDHLMEAVQKVRAMANGYGVRHQFTH